MKLRKSKKEKPQIGVTFSFREAGHLIEKSEPGFWSLPSSMQVRKIKDWAKKRKELGLTTLLFN